MIVHAFHAGKKLNTESFQASHKKDRFKFGSGLYSTVYHHVANNYVNSNNQLYLLEMDLDAKNCTGNIQMTPDDAMKFIGTLSKAVQKHWQSFLVIRNGRPMTLETLDVFFCNFIVKSHMYMQRLNDFFVDSGATFSTDHNGVIRLHDFKVLKNVTHNPSVHSFSNDYSNELEQVMSYTPQSPCIAF